MKKHNPYTIRILRGALYQKTRTNTVIIQILGKIKRIRRISENIKYSLVVKTINQQVLIELPFSLGQKQINVPKSIPDGSIVLAHIEVFIKMNVPTGVNLTIETGGIKIVNQNFGLC